MAKRFVSSKFLWSFLNQFAHLLVLFKVELARCIVKQQFLPYILTREVRFSSNVVISVCTFMPHCDVSNNFLPENISKLFLERRFTSAELQY